jgi:hypothetical protein
VESGLGRFDRPRPGLDGPVRNGLAWPLGQDQDSNFLKFFSFCLMISKKFWNSIFFSKPNLNQISNLIKLNF